eukprot:m.11543 g.11543  ORF g.11543 m.11543 type:complete len:890 (+) comp7427_c0_seq1:66-2735(+)
MLSRRISFQRPRVYTVTTDSPLFLSPDGDATDEKSRVPGVLLKEGESVEVRLVQPSVSGDLYGKVFHKVDLRTSTEKAVRAFQRYISGTSADGGGRDAHTKEGMVTGWVPMCVVEEYSLITESVTAVENVSDPEHTVNVECLAQTWDGSLWCGMGNGVVVRLDLETENCSRPLQAHRATVSCMVTTATHLWSGSFDRVVAVHSISPPELVAQLRGHTDCVTALVVGKRKQCVYSTDLAGVIFKWAADGFEQLAKVALNASIHCADFCNDRDGLWVGTGTGVVGLSNDLEIIAWISLQNEAFVLGAEAVLAALPRSTDGAGDGATVSAWHSVQQAGVRTANVAVKSALACGVEAAAHHARSAEVPVAPVASSRGLVSQARIGACRALAVGSHDVDAGVGSGVDVWAGGQGFLQFYKGGSDKCTMCWRMGAATMLQLCASTSEHVMCAAASDGWLLIFGLHSGRPIRKLKCHNDMVLSLAFVRTDRPGVLACGSAHNDGSITLCDGFHTLLGNRSSFLNDQIGAETMLNFDWLGFNTGWDSGAVTHRGQDATLVFDEEIGDVATFSYHQRCWEAWEHSFQQFSYSPETQLLARFGVPIHIRRRVWIAAIAELTDGTRKFKEKGGNNYYADITGYKAGKMSTNTRQIGLDLDRTFPTNAMFESLDGDVALALKRVLTAFSWHHPKIGYCQGLNRIAAMFLLILDEETTFWGLVGIVERVMTYEYYIDPLLAARIDMEVVQDLVALMMPKLHRHFRSVGFDIGAVCFQWLFSLFVTCLVPTVILRIWDAFLVQSCKSAEAGREVLFRYALGILKVHEGRMLEITDDVELHQYLARDLLAKTTDCDQLTQAAYSFSPDFAILLAFRVGEQGPLVRDREIAAAAKRTPAPPHIED